jgi:hypothetical protein
VPDWMQRRGWKLGALQCRSLVALATVFVAVVVYKWLSRSPALYVWSQVLKWTP